MTQGSGQQRQSAGQRQFRKAFTWTAGPIIVLSLVSVLGLYPFWFLAAIAWIGGLIAANVFFLRGRRSVAAGILSGVGVSAVALGLTCFANVVKGF